MGTLGDGLACCDSRERLRHGRVVCILVTGEQDSPAMIPVYSLCVQQSFIVSVFRIFACVYVRAIPG